METIQPPTQLDSDHTFERATRQLLPRKTSKIRRKFKNQCWTITNAMALLYILASITLPIVLIVPIAGKLDGFYDTCDADGAFSNSFPDVLFQYESGQLGYYTERFDSLFSSPSLVAITVPFGNYTFAQARLIDLSWDIGVGRIGQMLLVYVSYVAITRSMLHAMKTTSVPHQLFVNISFLGPSSMMTLWKVVTITPKSQLWKAWKGRLFIMALIMAYLISFPTLVSAMTGYVTTYSSRLEIEDGSVSIDLKDLRDVDLRVGNCSVFNLSNGCHVIGYQKSETEIVETGEKLEIAVYDSLYSGKIRYLMSL